MAYYLTLGKTAEFPLDCLRAFRVGGREVAVSNVDGVFYAFSNECTHMLAYLTDGFVREREIVCTWHWASFDLATGRTTNGPAGSNLAVYPVRTEGADLQIEWPEELAPDAVVPLNL